MVRTTCSVMLDSEAVSAFQERSISLSGWIREKMLSEIQTFGVVDTKQLDAEIAKAVEILSNVTDEARFQLVAQNYWYPRLRGVGYQGTLEEFLKIADEGGEKRK